MTGIVDENTEGATPGNTPRGAVRYLAPELIEDSNTPVTTGSDTFSFGMLMLECVTEETPLFDLPSFDTRITKIQYPPRPDGPDPKSCVSDLLWELMLSCWSAKCNGRPTMEQVHYFLSK